MKRFFKKIKAFLLESNHYKHLIGGFAVGMLGGSPWTAFYAGTIEHRVWSSKMRPTATNGTGLIGL